MSRPRRTLTRNPRPLTMLAAPAAGSPWRSGHNPAKSAGAAFGPRPPDTAEGLWPMASHRDACGEMALCGGARGRVISAASRPKWLRFNARTRGRQERNPMKLRVDVLRLTVVALAGLLLGMSAASAADYPTKPVRWIVPYPPGGGTDITARTHRTMAVRAARPAIHHREQAGRRQQSSAPRPSSTRAPDGYTVLLVNPGQRDQRHRSTRSSRSTSSGTSRRSAASSGCRT